jgi:hypothetical protein
VNVPNFSFDFLECILGHAFAQNQDRGATLILGQPHWGTGERCVGDCVGSWLVILGDPASQVSAELTRIHQQRFPIQLQVDFTQGRVAIAARIGLDRLPVDGCLDVRVFHGQHVNGDIAFFSKEYQ